MKIGLVIAAVVAVIAIAFGVYMIDIDQTQEAQLPEVTVEGGELPAFDAEVGDINVTEEDMTVTVPNLEVTPPDDANAASD
ncbi:hypothetical protein ACG74X_10995 [Marivita sp. S0852]|uniref:hypothetical protein n=1 Tax=Marivita sp. S0852 TaxID=3373893 RepID=UPI003981B0C0